MSNIDEISHCKLCKKFLENPILLPCGESVCYGHTFELSKKLCKLCNRLHQLPPDGFPINKALKDILNNRKIPAYKFDEMSIKDLSHIQDEINNLKIQKYNDCKNSIDELEMYIEAIQSFELDPKNVIQNYFNEISRNVELRRESMKLKIDAHYEKINAQIYTSLQQEIENLDNSNYSLNDDIKNTVKRFRNLSKEFTYENDKIDVDNVKKKVQELRLQLDRLLEVNEKRVLKNKQYKLHFKEDVKIEEFLGNFECIPNNSSNSSNALKKNSINQLEKQTEHITLKPGNEINSNAQNIVPKSLITNYLYPNCSNTSFINSRILNYETGIELLNLCRFSTVQKWKLIYQASKDGFKGHDFHSRCDNFPHTLTIIKTKNFSIFGGYTEKPWNTNYNWIKDNNSFIFSLYRSSNCRSPAPLKINCIDPDHAIYNNTSYGPVFGYNQGRGFDLCIKSDSDINFESHSELGNSYKLWSKEDNESTFLVGSKRFQTVEIEVYIRAD